MELHKSKSNGGLYHSSLSPCTCAQNDFYAFCGGVILKEKKVHAKAPSQIDTFVKDVSFARNISFLYAFIACCRLRLACTEFHILVQLPNKYANVLNEIVSLLSLVKAY